MASTGHWHGILRLARGVSDGVYGFGESVVTNASQGVQNHGAIGLVTGAGAGVLHGVGSLVAEVRSGVGCTYMNSKRIASTASGSYICTLPCDVRNGVGPFSTVVRKTNVGEELTAAHAQHDQEGFPMTLQLIDGSWIERRPPSLAQFFNPLLYESADCGLAPVHDFPAAGVQYVVAVDRLWLTSSWSHEGHKVRLVLCGEIVHAKRRIRYIHGGQASFDRAEERTRVQLTDNTWASVTVARPMVENSDEFLLKEASQEDITASDDRERRLRALLWCAEKEVEQQQLLVNLAGRAPGAMRVLGRLSGLDMKSALNQAKNDVQLLHNELSTHLQRPAARHGSISSQRSLPDRNGASRCFLPTAMLWTSSSTSIMANALTVGTTICGVFGETLTIASVTIHSEAMRKIVELRTREACLKVSATHRVTVPDPTGQAKGETPAGSLRAGDLVFSGGQMPVPVPLVKVLCHTMRTALVDITFTPDHPLESFQAPRWSLLSLGTPNEDQRSMPDTADGFSD